LATNYTRLIEFKVNDRQIKQATDRLFKSLDRIEKKLDIISRKGFSGLETGVNKAAKSVGKLSTSIAKASQGSRDFIRNTTLLAAGAAALAPQVETAARQVKFFGGALAFLPSLVTKASAAIGALAAAHPLLTAGIGGSVAAYTLFGSSITKVIPNVYNLGKAVRKVTDQIPVQVAKLTGAFKDLDTQVKVTTTGLIELAKGQGLQGLRQLLATATAEQTKLISTNTTYIAQVSKVREIQGAINQELYARQRILDSLVQKEGVTSGPGLDGLNKALGEQQAILDRMLSTQKGYKEQAIKVSEIQNLINKELQERDKIMSSINRKEERSVSLARRAAGGVGGFIKNNLGDAVGRRGLGVAAAGAAGKGIHDAFNQWNVAAGTKVGSMLGITTAKANLLQAALIKLGAIMTAHPGYAAAFAAAYMAFGLKAFVVPERAAAKLTTTLWGLGKTLAQKTAPSLIQAEANLGGFTQELKLSTEAARKFDIVTGRALAKAKLERGISTGSGNIQPSGFGAWSAKMEQRERTRKTFADTQRRKELKWANSLDAANKRTVLIKGKQLNIEQRINMVLERRRATQAAANQKGMFQGGARGAVSSAMIGGGFPLLFGQGGASAIGGGIGGAVGGAIGGGFGFGLSVVGTALGQAYEKNLEFNKSLAVLNVRLKDTGDGSLITAKEIDALAKKMNITKQEAMGVLAAFSEFDSKGVRMSLSRMFGKDSGTVDAIAAAQTQGALAEQIFAAREKIGNAKAEELLKQNLILDSATVELALARAIALEEHKKTLEKAKQITFMDRILAGAASDPMAGRVVDPSVFADERVKKLQAEFDKNKAEDAKNFIESLEEIRTLLGLVKKGTEATERVDALNQAFAQIGTTIRDGMVQAIEDAIDGTKTLGENVASVARQMARIMMNYAVTSSLKWMGLPGMAAGGPVSGGKSYLVGEKGPEIFKPNSSGTIIPNNKIGGSSDTNVVVNVDATGGSEVQGNEPSSQQLGRLLGAAVQAELIKQSRPGGILSR